MAPVACRECGHLVSTEAPACPSCGVPEPAPPRAAQSPRPEKQPWQRGDPYPEDLVPLHDPDVKGVLGTRRLGPYRAGEWVRVDRFSTQGFGRVLDRSIEFSRGFGTKLHPAWLVELESGERDWFSGISLHKLTKDERKGRADG